MNANTMLFVNVNLFSFVMQLQRNCSQPWIQWQTWFEFCERGSNNKFRERESNGQPGSDFFTQLQ